jgi:hypothetical protein
MTELKREIHNIKMNGQKGSKFERDLYNLLINLTYRIYMCIYNCQNKTTAEYMSFSTVKDN